MTDKLRANLDIVASTSMIIASVVVVGLAIKSSGAMRHQPVGKPVEDVTNLRQSLRVSTHPLQTTSTPKLVFIEFSDFQCPYCARFHNESYPRLVSQYVSTGKMAYVNINLPLEGIHPLSFRAATVAACAARQGKYQPMSDILFKGPLPADGNYGDLAVAAKLDVGLFNKCLPEAAEVVTSDVSEAKRLAVTTTPTFFVGILDGVGAAHLVSRINGAQPYRVFEDTLDRLTGVYASSRK